MTLGSALAAPDRVSIANLATGVSIEAQFNPREFSLSVQANYEQHQVPGAGYQPLHYVNTTNQLLPLELFYRVVTEEEMQQRLLHEAFLLALLYPRRGAGSIPQAAPPRVLVVWANVSVQCVVRSFAIRATLHNVWGEIVEETFSLQLERVSDGQIFSEDVARQGLMGGSSSPVGGGRP